MIHFLNQVQGHDAEIDHAVSSLLDRIGLPYTQLRASDDLGGIDPISDLLVVYSATPVAAPCRTLRIVPQPAVYRDPARAASLWRDDAWKDLPGIRGEAPPALEDRAAGGGLDDDAGPDRPDPAAPQSINLRLDTIASAYFLLARCEEIDPPAASLDGWGRFRFEASVLARGRARLRPLVEEYAALMARLLGLDAGACPLRPWSGRELAAVVTHDVDFLRRFRWLPPIRSASALATRALRPGAAARLLGDYAAVKLGLRRDPYDNLGEIADLSSSLGLVSTFYFMAGRTGPRDADYDVESPAVRALVAMLRDRGCEVGFHAGFDTQDSEERFLREKQRVERSAGPMAGGRQHCLRWRTPITWKVWAGAGMHYDSTLGFAEAEGFRCGTALPFRAFDAAARRPLDIWELPLCVMDQSLLKYQGLSPAEGRERVLGLIDAVRRCGGVFVLLWHNSFLHERELPGWSAVYTDVLHALVSAGALGLKGSEAVGRWARHCAALESPAVPSS